MYPPRRAAKRIKNRLAKQGLEFLRFEQASRDHNLDLIRVILQTKRDRLGRAFTYNRAQFLKLSPRAIADGVISDYVKGYGAHPSA